MSNSKLTRVEFRVTHSQKEEFIERSKSFGSQVNYFMHLLNSDTGEPVFSIKPPASSNILQNGIGWHLSRIGNNLNQLAYVINKANLADKVDDKLAQEIAKELMYLNILINDAIDKNCELDKAE